MVDQIRTPSAGDFAAGRPAIVSCWLCGTHLQHNQMVADGGSACSDIRWYCRDTRACTERWTAARRQARAAEAGAAPGRGAGAAPLPRRRREPLPARPSPPGSPDRGTGSRMMINTPPAPGSPPDGE
jgi:hypothetical protein